MSEHIGRVLLIAGGLLLLLGLLVIAGGRLGLGRLPGDLIVRRENFVFYFPLMTGIVISLALSILFYLLHRL